jgi:hypothetical protein
MSDTLKIARTLTRRTADTHAEAIATAVGEAAEHHEYVTPERIRTELAESRRAGAIVGAIVGIAGLVTGSLRLIS